MGYRQAFRKAFPYTIPVLTGYLFIGIAFGVMFAEKGYSFLWAVLMSLLVYAGSGSFDPSTVLQRSPQKARSWQNQSPLN